jgi:hypothetical protein
MSSAILRTREHGDIYPTDSFSLSRLDPLGVSGLTFSNARSVIRARQKNSTYAFVRNLPPFYAGLVLPSILPVPLSHLFFYHSSLHPFRPPVRLSSLHPATTLSRACFRSALLPLSHCHRSPLFSSMPRPRPHLVSRLPVFSLPISTHPIVQFSRVPRA